MALSVRIDELLYAQESIISKRLLLHVFLLYKKPVMRKQDSGMVLSGMLNYQLTVVLEKHYQETLISLVKDSCVFA